jgi:hypothetical protein
LAGVASALTNAGINVAAFPVPIPMAGALLAPGPIAAAVAGAPGTNLQKANAVTALTAAGALVPGANAVIPAAGLPAATAFAPQPVGVVAIRIRNTGEIVSMYPI